LNKDVLTKFWQSSGSGGWNPDTDYGLRIRIGFASVLLSFFVIVIVVVLVLLHLLVVVVVISLRSSLVPDEKLMVRILTSHCHQGARKKGTNAPITSLISERQSGEQIHGRPFGWQMLTSVRGVFLYGAITTIDQRRPVRATPSAHCRTSIAIKPVECTAHAPEIKSGLDRLVW